MATNRPGNTPASDDAVELLSTLTITRQQPRKGVHGGWVCGTIGGHDFESLVFPEHAESETYELGDSRISKLCVRSGRTIVAAFDRGWDIQPTTDAARQIVDLLAAGLAELVFGK